jgi:hypothetical protein
MNANLSLLLGNKKKVTITKFHEYKITLSKDNRGYIIACAGIFTITADVTIHEALRQLAKTFKLTAYDFSKEWDY